MELEECCEAKKGKFILMYRNMCKKREYGDYEDEDEEMFYIISISLSAFLHPISI